MSEGLSDRITAADNAATVLDDKVVLENRAVYKWLLAHQLHAGFHKHLVIGSERLPPAWKDRTIRFTSRASADALVRDVARNSHALPVLKSLLRNTGRLAPYGPVTKDLVLQSTSQALLDGRLWAMDAKPMKNVHVDKTTPSVFDSLNVRFRTAVDFRQIAKFEGGQWLRGYIPFSNNGIVSGQSGMTIATGFDMGQWSEAQLKAMGFGVELLAKFRPFVGRRFKGFTRHQVESEVAKLGPVPEITKVEADQIDGAVMGNILSDAIAAWDSRRGRKTPAFRDLPSGWQTVWTSRFFQEGAGTKLAAALAFRKAAVDGRWNDAILAMGGYSGDYKSRATEEAALLRKELPQEVKTASPPGPQRLP